MTPVRRSLVLAAAMAAACAAPAPGGESAAGWRHDMKAELAAWEAPGVSLDLSRGEPVLPILKRCDLKLRPIQSVRFAVLPNPSFDPGPFAGTVLLRVPKSGAYKVCYGGACWIDPIELATKETLHFIGFESKVGSEVRKIVLFKFEAGKDYLLEISSSQSPKVSLMVSPDGG